jgi:hypothetical protein
MQLCRPEPAYPTNAPIEELRTPELFVLAALRHWVAPQRDPGGTHGDWRGAFEAASIEDTAAPSFDSFLRILGTAALAPLDVRCVKCARLGEDEAWMLQLVSLMQRDRVIEAAAILDHWLPRATARIAFAHVGSFAAAMAGARLVVPHRPGLHEAAAAAASAPPTRRPQLALVH